MVLRSTKTTDYISAGKQTGTAQLSSVAQDADEENVSARLKDNAMYVGVSMSILKLVLPVQIENAAAVV
jgi:penicillin-binding protein 2